MVNISIIMPIYNAEKSLCRAIDSIILQSSSNWELLLIDDGSDDTSPIICDEYANKDKRIKVIHKKNEGVAIARQTGIKLATGKYTIHLDSDDWVEPTMLEEIHNKAEQENIDFLILDYYINSDYKEVLITQNPTSNNPQEIINEILENKLFGALWNKLIKTDLYKKYNITFFNEINYCEDVLACAQILKHKEIKAGYLNKAFYHYVTNPNSITYKISRPKYEMRQLFQLKLNEILTEECFKKAKDISSLSIFAEGFINRCLSKQEIKEEFKKNQYAAFHFIKSPRWLIGYFLIKIRCYKLAHLFIKY